MTVETLTRTEFARELGYVDLNGNVSQRSVAQVLRDALSRWGLSPRRALLKYAREQLRAGDLSVESVPSVLEQLVALGECAEVAIGHEKFIAPAEPRWIAIGGKLAVALGTQAIPGELPRVTGLPPDDLAVRIGLDNEEAETALEAGGWRQVYLEEWLYPCNYLHHIARRKGGAIRCDQWSLAGFWEYLVTVLVKEGLLLSSDAEIRSVIGTAGGFFGTHTAVGIEGRWGEKPSNGVWCAYRRAHGNNRWLPTLISVDGGECRALDLFDHDEWRWALLARSKAVGPDEVVKRENGEERTTWPLPVQLRSAMNIIGVPIKPWCWQISDDAPDLWSIFK